MKFGTELQAHLTPEWRQQYIEYEVNFSFQHLSTAKSAARTSLYLIGTFIKTGSL